MTSVANMLNVIYSTNIVAATYHQNHWSWYITEKELWFMDRIHWGLDFGLDRDYLNNPDNHHECFDIPIVNEQTASEFLLSIEGYRVNRNDLTCLVSERFADSSDWTEDRLELYPSVFVDFASRKLKSLFPEPSGKFYEYVPVGWQGSYENFLGEIPKDERYWIIEGRDYFTL